MKTFFMNDSELTSSCREGNFDVSSSTVGHVGVNEFPDRPIVFLRVLATSNLYSLRQDVVQDLINRPPPLLCSNLSPRPTDSKM